MRTLAGTGPSAAAGTVALGFTGPPVGCGGAPLGASSTRAPAGALSNAAAVGDLLFNDAALSASGQPSCTTCRDRAHGFAAADGLEVPLGGPLFHQGVFATFRRVIRGYVTRDLAINPGINPANNPDPEVNRYLPAGSGYLAADGSADALLYNDLPQAFDGNVNVGERPYTPPRADGGEAPTLASAGIDAVLAFLRTLTDGFDPAHPVAYVLSAPCPAVAPAAVH